MPNPTTAVTFSGSVPRRASGFTTGDDAWDSRTRTEPNMTRNCRQCEKSFVVSERRRPGRKRQFCSSRCRQRHLREYCRVYQAARNTPETRRTGRLRRKYGITLQQWDALFQAQGEGCAGCQRSKELSGRRLAVDHNHATRAVRGLLCFRCNTIIGKCNEDSAVLIRLAAYLNRYQENLLR